jgi:methyl-accepting chemotaxis protein
LLLWFVILRASPALFRLRQVNRRLRALDGYYAFRYNFAEVNEAFDRIRMLRHGWSEFKKTLIVPRDGKAAPIRNTARPSSYLNLGAIAPELHLPFYQAVPNYFVGFGLLFTFLGLVAALHFASQGVAGKSPAAQAALQDLLSAATFKFSTSIAGLLSSLLFSIVLKRLTIQLQIHFDRLCSLLEQKLVAVTSEQVATDQQRELEKQTEQLERFNTDFAVEVAKALEDRFNHSLGNVIGQAMRPMVSAIQDMSKNFGDVNQDAMERIVKDFQISLQGAAGSQMQAIGTTLGRLGETLEAAVAKMEDSGGQFGNRLEDAARQLESVVSGAGHGLQAQIGEAASRLESLVQEMSRTIQESLAGASRQLMAAADGFGDQFHSALHPVTGEFDRITGALQAVDAKLRAHLGGFDASVEQLAATSRALGTLLEQVREVGGPLSKIADRLHGTASRIEQTGNVMGDAHAKLTEVAKSILTGAQVVHSSWDKYRERFERVDHDLEGIFSKLQDGTLAYHESILEYVKCIDDHFATAANLLNAGIQDLQRSVEDLAETTGRMSRAAE